MAHIPSEERRTLILTGASRGTNGAELHINGGQHV
jgi:hypothetical protein